MPEPSEEALRQIEALRAGFSARLEKDRQRLRQLLETVRQCPSEQAALVEMYRLAHGLAGAAGTFGQPAVGHLSRDLEAVLASFVERGSSPAAEDLQRIDELLRGLEAPPLPVERTPVPSVASPQEPRDAPIYLVEDEPGLARDLATQIGHFGYEVQVLTQLADLRPAVHALLPAAVIMDVEFPEGGLAGAEAMANIQQELAARIPVIFISSRSDIAARLLALRAGGQAYLTKPVDILALVDRLDALTGRKKPEPPRVLLIDDDPVVAAQYVATLERVGMIAVALTDPMRALDFLAEFAPDLILMDIYMPECSGLELAGVIRQQEAYVGIPIVFISADARIDRQVAAMRLGGDDFLAKPVDPDRLVWSVAARVQRFSALRALMARDGLTGLLNHTRLMEQLSIELTRARRQRGRLALAMLDIDRFKSVNDTYGHSTGDRVLKGLSRLLQQRLRKTDVIGRYGGEEFAVVFTETEAPTAARILDEIRERFAQVRHRSGDVEFHVTLSAGVAGFPDYPEEHTLREAADKALYRAKAEGRNRVVIAQTPPT